MNKKIQFKKGMSFHVMLPFSAPNKSKVHIMYVLPSIYKDQKLIIYRVFGKHKRWWHEFMCTDVQMQFYKELVKP